MKAYERAIFNQFKQENTEEIEKFQKKLLSYIDKSIAVKKNVIVELVTEPYGNSTALLEESKVALNNFKKLKDSWENDEMMFDEEETKELLGLREYNSEIAPIYSDFLSKLYYKKQ